MLYQILAPFIHEKKKPNRNNKFNTSAPTLNDKFELPNGSYSVSDIQDYFEYINQKHEKQTYNRPIQTYVNKIENRVTINLKTGHCSDRLTHEITKSPWCTEKKIIKDKNSENVPHLEITAVVLVHCNNVNNDCQHIQEPYMQLFPINHLVNY